MQKTVVRVQNRAGDVTWWHKWLPGKHKVVNFIPGTSPQKRFHRILKIELPCDPSIPLLDVLKGN